jgi:hypothetical protein
MVMLLDSLKEFVEKRRKREAALARIMKREKMERVRRLAPREIEKTLGRVIDLPPRDQWEMEPINESVCTQEGWVDLFLRIKIDDIELYAGWSHLDRSDIAFVIRGQCSRCKRYLYYYVSLARVEDLLNYIEMAQQGIIAGNLHRCLCYKLGGDDNAQGI